MVLTQNFLIMSYFNHAYNKAFFMGNKLLSASLKDNNELTTAFTAADFGVCNVEAVAGPIVPYSALSAANVATHAATTGAGSSASAYSSSKIILAQGSWHAADTIGGNSLMGGYGETIKSKDIQFRHINRVSEVTSAVGANQIVEFKALGATSSQSCFPCGSDPQIRIDVKGADALRMLNHNAYRNVDIGAICHCCGDDGDYLFPSSVVATWASNIKKDPILSKLIDTTAANFFSYTTNAGGLWTNSDPDTFLDNAALSCLGSWTEQHGGKLMLNMGVVDTTFGTCSFDTRDWTNVEPLTATVELLEEDGVTCDTCLITTNPLIGAAYTNGGPAAGTTDHQGAVTSSGDGTGTSVVPAQRIGDGNTVLKDVLLTQRYLQEPYNQGNKDSSRYRTIEGHADILSNSTAGVAVDTSARYHQFHLQHVVPRFNNPSGTFDNDQYLYTVYTNALETDGTANVNLSDLSTIWTAIAAAAQLTKTTY